MYLIILCLGNFSVDNYNFRKQLLFKDFIFKFLDKKLKYFLNKNLDKNLLKGHIALILINKVNYYKEYLIINNLLQENKNYICLGIINKDNFYSINFFKENIQNSNYNLINYNNVKVLNNITYCNNNILNIIKYVNYKSNS